MKLLLDTQLLLWAAGQPERLSASARKQLRNPRNELLFSAASIWEIAIKNTLGRSDFRVEPRLLRRGLLDNGYVELPITSQHAVGIDALPLLHKDPSIACCSPKRLRKESPCSRATYNSPFTTGPCARYSGARHEGSPGGRRI